MKKILWFILIIQLFLRMPFIFEPLNADEATYLQISSRMRQGEILYRDLVDIKPPGLFYVYMLLGRDPVALRVWTMVLALFMTVLVFIVGRELIGEKGALASAFFHAVFSGGVFIEGTQANSETFMILPLLLAFYCFIKGLEGKGGYIWGAGLFSGMAFLIKQTAAFSFLGLFFSLIFLKRKLRLLFLLLLGFIVFPSLVAVYYLYMGAFKDLVNALIFYSLGMAKTAFLNFLIKTAFLFAFENSVLWIMALAGAVLIVRKLSETKLKTLLLWTVFTFLGVYAAGYALGRYFIPLVLCLSFLGGVAVEHWKNLFAHRSSQVIFVILLVAFGLLIIDSEWPFYLKYSPEEISNERYGTTVNSAARKIGLLIREKTRPGDFVFGLSPAVFYSGRNSCAKYYLTVRGGRSEVWFLGKLIYAHDFGIRRDPKLTQKIDEDFYRCLSNPKTKYWVVYAKDYYAPADVGEKLRKNHFVLDQELSQISPEILVFRR